MIHKRPLGRTDITISPLVFGGNVFGWTADKDTSFNLLDRFIGAGFETVDTADVYSVWKAGNSGGESETILGEWMRSRGCRDRTIVITKVGMQMTPEGKGLSAAWIEREVEESLRRLQTDYIDIYLSHKYDPDTPHEETLAAYQKLITAGKVRGIGASNFDAAQLRAALDASDANGLPRYEVLQPEYNLHDRKGYEGALRDLALVEELGVITYYSLARGFLSGKYRSEADLGQSPRGGGIKGYLNERGFRILQALDEVASRHQTQPAEVALAWLMTRPGVTAPIVSATSLSQLESLIWSATLALKPEDLVALEVASR